jgi:hypothetical protein
MAGFPSDACRPWHPRAVAADRGDVLMGWVVKIAVVLGVIGLALFDGISISSTSVTLADQGSYAAQQASEVWLQGQNLQKTYDAAVIAAKEQNADNSVATKDFRVDSDGTVHLTLARTANTIVVRRIGPLKHWADIRHGAHGRSVS